MYTRVHVQTGTDWFQAIKSEWAQPSYIGLDLPWSQRIIVIVNTLLVGGVEILRNTELDPEVVPCGGNLVMLGCAVYL